MNSGVTSGKARVLHLFECSILHHGAMWLDLIVEGFVDDYARIIVTLPDSEVYGSFVAKYKSHEKIVFNVFEVVEGKSARHHSIEPFKQVSADHTLITYWDHLAKRKWWSRLEDVSGAVWGICFLSPFTSERVPWRHFFSTKAKKRRALARDLTRTPDFLKGMFCLDPEMAAYFDRRGCAPWRLLPDPWNGGASSLTSPEARARLGLPESAKIFLHAGGEHPRKGLEDVLSVWETGALPDSAYLVRAGVTRAHCGVRLRRLESAGRAHFTDHFLTDEELNDYIQAADWVLLPYRDHRGSSGLLGGAAIARKPVICSRAGLLGATVEKYKLGLLYKHKSVEGLETALLAACDSRAETFHPGLDAYREAHSVEDFQHQLRRVLVGAPNQA